MTISERNSGNDPQFAEGIARYVDLFRAQPPTPDLSEMRLGGDLTARRFSDGGYGFADFPSKHG